LARCTRDREVDITPGFKPDAESLRLATAVQAELTEKDWEQFYRWFRLTKLEIIQTATLAEIDPASLPDSEVGRMVDFDDIFPWGRALDFPLDNDQWTVDEQYCVRRR
jgi:hypothetical protein